MFQTRKRNSSMSSKKVLIDCDPGCDDAHAICMAVANRNIEVVAITTVFGNVSVDQTTTNALRVLYECGAMQIPVYKGCGRSLLGQGSQTEFYYGHDGLGDTGNQHTPPLPSHKKDHAILTILRLAEEHSGELEVVALGPLTNIALALHLNPQLSSKIAHLVIMGGNTKGRGNATPHAEFNFWNDPEAAMFVLQHFGGQMTLLDLEVCQTFSPSWEFFDRLISAGTPNAKFLGRIFKKMGERLENLDVPKFISYDQAAIGFVINDKIALKTKSVYVTVELTGRKRGQMVVDWNGELKNKPNVTLVTELDMEINEELMQGATKDTNPAYALKTNIY